MSKVTRKKAKKNTSFTTWKLNLENVVNADPRLGPACLKIVRAYLDWMGSPAARPFLSIIHLRVATALTEPTIIKARRELEKEGYLVPDGRTSSGAVMYRIVNSGENRVLDHMAVSRETLRRMEAEKKEKERQKRPSPKENLDPLSPKESLGLEAEMPSRNFRDSPKETLGNNVYYSVEVISNEREEHSNSDTFIADIDLENIKSDAPKKIGPSLENAYLAAARGDDPDQPLPVPANDDEAESMMDAICEGRHIHASVRKQVKQMLGIGFLTPAKIDHILGPNGGAA